MFYTFENYYSFIIYSQLTILIFMFVANDLKSSNYDTVTKNCESKIVINIYDTLMNNVCSNSIPMIHYSYLYKILIITRKTYVVIIVI